VELSSIDITFEDLDMSVDAWFHNPLPFPITLASVYYDVYFKDLDGADCIDGYCYYSPVPDFYLATVMEPGLSTPTVQKLHRDSDCIEDSIFVVSSAPQNHGISNTISR
jgi:hypothetical protein